MRQVEVAEIVQNLKELGVYGYTVIKGLLSRSDVGGLLEKVNALYDPRLHSTFAGRPERELSDKMVYHLQNRDKQFIDLLSHAALEAILMEVLNDPYYKHLPKDVPNYILSFYNARSSGSQLDLHTDTFVPSPGDKTWTMQALFNLEASDAANGCSVVVPGSHRTGRFVDREMTKLEQIHAQPGDVVLWDSRIWHGTMPNTSGRSRWALVATFGCWWVKQRCDMPRSLPDSIYKELSDRQKALLGFCSIPPKDEQERLNFKCGYDVLKPSVSDYFK